MGIYDRDYYDEPQRQQGFTFGGGPRMMVTNLVIVTVAIVVIDLFTPAVSFRPNPEPGSKPLVVSHWLGDLMSLDANVYRRPWMAFQLVTYGFAHAPLDSPEGIWHVALNMFLLWMFGRVIESRLGRKEFLLFYLVAIVFSGLVWLVSINSWLALGGAGTPDKFQIVGASGAVTAVFISYVLLYPKQTVYIWGLFAVPAWLIGAILIGQDLIRALLGSEDNVAWQAHLGGAAFAFLYLRLHWNFSRLLPQQGKWKLPKRGPRLRVHNPDDDRKLDDEADRILEKVHREGEESLTSRERRILEKYSRRVREKRR